MLDEFEAFWISRPPRKNNAGADAVERRLKLDVPPDLTGLPSDVSPHGLRRHRIPVGVLDLDNSTYFVVPE